MEVTLLCTAPSTGNRIWTCSLIRMKDLLHQLSYTGIMCVPRLERGTFCISGKNSDQLSYTHKLWMFIVYRWRTSTYNKKLAEGFEPTMCFHAWLQIKSTTTMGHQRNFVLWNVRPSYETEQVTAAVCITIPLISIMNETYSLLNSITGTVHFILVPPDGLSPPPIRSRAHGYSENQSLYHHVQPYMSVVCNEITWRVKQKSVTLGLEPPTGDFTR